MKEVPPKTLEKLQTLTQIATDLRRGKDFNITRLTMMKSLCSDPDAAAQFALCLAKKDAADDEGHRGSLAMRSPRLGRITSGSWEKACVA